MNFKLYVENLEAPLFHRKASELNTITVNVAKWKELGLPIPPDLPLIRLKVPKKDTFIDLMTLPNNRFNTGIALEFPGEQILLKITSSSESLKASSSSHVRIARFAKTKREIGLYGDKLIFGTAQDAVEGGVLTLSLDELELLLTDYLKNPEAYKKHLEAEKVTTPKDEDVIRNVAFSSIKVFDDLTRVKTLNSDFLTKAIAIFNSILIPDGLSKQKITNVQDIKGLHVPSRKEVIDRINHEFQRIGFDKRYALEQFNLVKPIIEDIFKNLTRTTMNIYDLIGDKSISLLKLTGRENGQERTKVLTVKTLKDSFMPNLESKWGELTTIMGEEFKTRIEEASKILHPLFI
jgi:hypothetical protein